MSSSDGTPQVPDHIDECQDCEDGEATHVCAMTIGDIPVGPLYVCDDCHPEEVPA